MSFKTEDQPNIDFAEIVNEAATSVERELNVKITQEAKDALLSRVRKHIDVVNDELSSGRATVASILEAAKGQLRAAADEKVRAAIDEHAREGDRDSTFLIYDPEKSWRSGGGSSKPSILSTDVVLSMKSTCLWIPWC